MLALALSSLSFNLPTTPRVSALSASSPATFDRRDMAALAAAAAFAFVPANAFAEDAPPAEEKKEPPKKKKGPCGDVECGPAAKGQKTALGFVTSDPAPQFRPAGALKSVPFKPPPLGKLDPKKTRPQYFK